MFNFRKLPQITQQVEEQTSQRAGVSLLQLEALAVVVKAEHVDSERSVCEYAKSPLCCKRLQHQRAAVARAVPGTPSGSFMWVTSV